MDVLAAKIEDQSFLTKSGQHDRNPVTTKHEKRFHANHLFAVSYGSLSREALALKTSLADPAHRLSLIMAARSVEYLFGPSENRCEGGLCFWKVSQSSFECFQP
jgi:hypothetical protein